MNGPSTWQGELSALVRSRGPARETLRAVVVWLDERLHPTHESFDASTFAIDPVQQIFVRMTHDIGCAMAAKRGMPDDSRFAETLRAARRYLAEPTPQRHADYVAAATASYPYGAGDGCYGVLDAGSRSGAPCGPGSGCASGSGTLEMLADAIGADAALHIVRGVLAASR